jgi:hypothetical protein
MFSHFAFKNSVIMILSFARLLGLENVSFQNPLPLLLYFVFPLKLRQYRLHILRFFDIDNQFRIVPISKLKPAVQWGLTHAL